MATTIEPPPGRTRGIEKDVPGDGGASSRRRIAGATGIMMAGILASRLLGLVRERVIAHQFGQGFWTDVYNGAFTIPDLLFFLIAGGAFSSAFIPVFTEYLEMDNERDAWRIFSAVATVMGLVVTVFIILGEIFTPQLVVWTNPGYLAIPGKVEATVGLTRILLPAQICFFLGGLMMGTLQVRHRFGPVVLGPMIYNIGIICGGIFLARRFGISGLCWGAVVGAVIGNLCLQWVMVVRSGGCFVWRGLSKHLRHPGVKQVWRLMLPVILGLALPQVSTIIGKMFASRLGDGPQSALMYANKLLQVPLGVFAQSTAQAAFPTMAAQAARGEIAALRSTVSYGLRSILFLTIPSSLLLFVLALPAVQLLLQTGKYTVKDAEMAAACLRFFAIGLFAWSGHSIITRGFYALKDSRTPVIVGTAVTAIFVPLNYVVLWIFGSGTRHQVSAVAGLALVTSLAASIHMLTMLVLLRTRLRGIEGGRLLVSVGRMLAASLAAALVCKIIRDGLEHRFAAAAGKHVFVHSFTVLAACLIAGSAVYGLLAIALRMEEAAILVRMGRRAGRALGFA